MRAGQISCTKDSFGIKNYTSLLMLRSVFVGVGSENACLAVGPGSEQPDGLKRTVKMEGKRE